MNKILVVDDSPTELRVVSDSLQRRGFQVITATDGEDAITKAETEQPSLIVLDIVMPKKNGFQVCRQLKRDAMTQHIKVILLTSKDQPSDRFWGLKQGADAYLVKPFQEDDLMQNVMRLI